MNRPAKWFKKDKGPLFDAEGRVALTPYDDCDPAYPWFQYIRYDWKSEGPRCGISAKVQAKLEPMGHKAYHHEVLLPAGAPGGLKAVEELLRAYDAALPAKERYAYVQFTIAFDPDTSWQDAWEDTRQWARAQFVGAHNVAALLVHHVPALAGSASDPHIHVIVPLRKLDANGFGAHAGGIGTDKGFEAALASWLAWSEHGAATSVQ